MRRGGAALVATLAASVGLMIAGLTLMLMPASAQIVDSGTFDESLECAGVFVDGVNPDDSLNVREGPGVVHPVVLTLEPAAPAIATGLTSPVGNSTWYQIGIGDCEPVGWVNSSFLSLDDSIVPVPTTTPADTTPEPDPTEADVAPDTGSDDSEDSGSNIRLSPFATALLGLGFLGLLTGVTMFVRGRHSARDEGPPPGMVGPPGGPYLLTRVERRSSEPKTITVGRAPDQNRRSTDLSSEPIDQPLSAFPLVPDLASEIQAEADKMTRPSSELFDTNSLGVGNGAEDENGS